MAINQILPPAITVGYKEINPYPSTNSTRAIPSKCKSMLAAAGYPHGLNLTLVYANNPPMPAQAVALQSDFAQGGGDDQVQRAADPGCVLRLHRDAVEQGELGPGLRRVVPGLDRNGAQSIFGPLLDGRQYAKGSTDYGDYNDSTVNK